MSISRRERIRRASMAAASLIVLCSAGAALAEPASAPVPSAGSLALKPLPAAPEDLVLQGESARRSFSVTLSGTEPDDIRQLQVGFTSSVVLLPERSSLKVTINGHALAPVPLRAATAVATVPVEVPGGLLRPGANTVDIEAAMQHRVDCSIGATYELWTRLDPARTGFLAPGAAAGPTAAVGDLARQARAADGTTRIHLHAPAPLDPAAMERAAALIGGLVAQAHLPRPVVDLGPDAGQGAGFDLLLDEAALPGAPFEGRDGGLAFARDAGTGRLSVVLMGRADAERDAAVAELAARKAAPSPRDRDLAIRSAARVRLADLDVRQGDFAGRHGQARFGAILPADFFPGDYDKARFLADATFAGGLEAGSTLAIRVNGVLAATAPLNSAQGGTLRQHAMDLPLRLFHAGRNEIAIDSTATWPEDRQCEARPQDAAPRFALSPGSELVFPAFARLGTAPQLADAPAASDASVPVYVADDAEAAGAALTVLANKAASGDPVAHPAVRFAMPDADDAPGLVVAAWNDVPGRLASPLADALAIKDASWKIPASEAAAAPSSPIDRALSWGGDPNVAQAWQDLRSLGRSVSGYLPAVSGVLPAGIGKAVQPGGTARLPASARTLLFAAAEPNLRRSPATALPLPAISTDARQWLLVTAPSASLIRSGLERFVAEGRWPSLQGRAVSYDPDRKAVATLAPAHVTYLLPDHVVLSDLRPVLGGLVSDNIEVGAITIVLLIAMLGASTHALVRRPGGK